MADPIMADLKDSSPDVEPSMDEILSSIRKIIAEEPAPVSVAEDSVSVESDHVSAEPDPMVVSAPVMATDDLELEQTSSEISFEPLPQAKQDPTPELEAVEPIVDVQPAPPTVSTDGLMSSNVAAAAAAGFAEFANQVEKEREAAQPSLATLGGGKTLEEVVIDVMRPFLREWLDANLPEIVTQVVKKEVERIARNVE